MTGFPISRSALLDFARLLGARYLVADRYWDGEALRLVLPPIHVRALNSFLLLPARWLDNSWVEVSAEGKCRSYLSRRDWGALCSLVRSQRSATELQHNVEGAVEISLKAFVRGDMEAAIRHVETESDEQVFRKAPHELGSQKALYRVGIVCMIIALIIFTCLWLMFQR
jgi:hypothetical protein